MPIKKPQAKKPAPKKKLLDKVNKAVRKADKEKLKPTATKKATAKKTVPKKKTEEREQRAKPIKLAMMLFEMQMHLISKKLLTEKQGKCLAKKLDKHRDKIKDGCNRALCYRKNSTRANSIRNLAVSFFLKVSKKKKQRIQEAVKKTFQTF